MSPLVRKEVRALLPPWILAMLLATVPVWLTWSSLVFHPSAPGYLVSVPFSLGVLLLSLTPFGQELNWGTFSVLLAQPVSRARIWRVKTLLLATALGLVFVAFLVSNWMWIDSAVTTARNTVYATLLNRPGGDHNLEVMLVATRRDALSATWMIGGLGVLSGFAGGLWTTLLFRQVSAAFWFTLLVPLGLMLLSGLAGDAATCVVLGVYSAAGFFWARKQFEQVQDTQWTGGVVSLPAWGAATETRAIAKRRKRRAVRALIGKELQAQYVNLLLAGGLLVIHIIIVLIRRLGADYFAVHRSLVMTLESFPILWLAMPLLVGSVAIAEERKLGTFEVISCAPISRRLQFGIKLALTLALGVLLGAIVPLAIERGGAPALRSDISFAFGIGIASVMSLAWLSLVASFGISLLAFFGSSLTRNTLQALGSGVLGCVIAALLITVGAYPRAVSDGYLWGSRLLGLVLTPLLAITIVVLAYRNYRHVLVTGRMWRRNGLALGAVLVAGTVITSAVYHRFWEAWQPVEPKHGWQVVYGNERPDKVTPKVDANGWRIAALLSDGRLWLRQPRTQPIKIVRGPTGYVIWQPTGRAHSGFLPGANWRDVAASGLGCFAIQKNGTLWDLSNVLPGAKNADAQMHRVDDAQDWTHVSSASLHCCGLKSDGTLWEWGYPHTDRTASAGPLAAPVQIGNDHDWIAVADSFQCSVAVKADGTVWRWGWIQNWDRAGQSQTNRLFEQPQRWLSFPGPQRPSSLSCDGYEVAAVCDDGTLWFGGSFLNLILGSDSAVQARSEMVRFGTDSDWRQITLSGTANGIAVKQNGSLLKWDQHHFFFGRHFTSVPLIPASQYPVWTSVCRYRSAFLALGRDDMLCVWGDPNAEGFAYNDLNGPDPSRLLLPSRIEAREIADLSR